MRNEKKMEKSLRISPADVLLALLVLTAVLLGGGYLWKRRGEARPTVTVTYLLRLPSREAELLEGERGILSQMPKGAAVCSQNGTASLGTVTDRRVEQVLRPAVRDGEAILLEDPFHRHLYVTVTGQGIRRPGDGLRIRDIRIAAGMRGDFRIGGYLAENADILAVWEEDGV
ncbi:MAG: DUF4330 family protein [Clostridia bacterium]|nr:DUF4330 family protein [Clostridia bacterium]